MTSSKDDEKPYSFTVLFPAMKDSSLIAVKGNYIRSGLVQALLIEVKRGVDKYGDFRDLNQFREALKEEYQELTDELEAETIDLIKVWKEAMQVAAVAIRGIEEIERRSLG